jgi:hypothetical protein
LVIGEETSLAIFSTFRTPVSALGVCNRKHLATKKVVHGEEGKPGDRVMKTEIIFDQRAEERAQTRT